MSFNQKQLIAVFTYDGVTNALLVPDAMPEPGLAAEPYPLTIVACPTGPRPLFVTDLEFMTGDIVITDPSNDVYVGWDIASAVDGTATPTFTVIQAYTADGDLPLIHDNSLSTTALQAVVNIPVNLFNYVGQSRASPDVMYATLAAQPANKLRAPIRIAEDSIFRVRLGCYVGGSLTAVTGNLDWSVAVWGFYV